MEIKLSPQPEAFEYIKAALWAAFPATFAGMIGSEDDLRLIFIQEISSVEKDLAVQLTQDAALDYLNTQSVNFNMEIPDGNS